MPWIYLVLVVLVLVVGLGVVVLNRRRGAAAPPAPSAPVRAPKPPPPQAPVEAVAAPEEVADTAVEVEVERPNFRSRMSKARNALAGTLLGIRARGGITSETWDDLEEALLRADVGVRVTDDLLGGLRTKVKAKEITDPVQLLDALQAEMVERLSGADRTLAFDDVPGGPNVWLFVGVNGVGKTTTIGKVVPNRLLSGGRC